MCRTLSHDIYCLLAGIGVHWIYYKNPSNGKNEDKILKNRAAVFIPYSKTEAMRNKSMKEINEKEKAIIQDNADLIELEKRYDDLPIPYKDRRIIDDYIACILSRQERMESLIYYAGRKDAVSCGR